MRLLAFDSGPTRLRQAAVGFLTRFADNRPDLLTQATLNEDGRHTTSGIRSTATSIIHANSDASATPPMLLAKSPNDFKHSLACSES